jgi:threonyl-tRNA synthetase
MLIVGDKEIEEKAVSVRKRDGSNLSMQISKFIGIIKDEIEKYQ